MKVKILVFGVAKDVVGSSVVQTDLSEPNTIASLKKLLKDEYPQLPDFMIAVNSSYAKDNQLISTDDEVALIPPTNGG